MKKVVIIIRKWLREENILRILLELFLEHIIEILFPDYYILLIDAVRAVYRLLIMIYKEKRSKNRKHRKKQQKSENRRRSRKRVHKN